MKEERRSEAHFSAKSWNGKDVGSCSVVARVLLGVLSFVWFIPNFLEWRPLWLFFLSPIKY